jgi:hypothetical protein
MRRTAKILKGQKVTSFADGRAHGNASQRPNWALAKMDMWRHPFEASPQQH